MPPWIAACDGETEQGADGDQRHREDRTPHQYTGYLRLAVGRAAALREDLDREQPEDEAADVGEVGDAAATAGRVVRSTAPKTTCCANQMNRNEDGRASR